MDRPPAARWRSGPRAPEWPDDARQRLADRFCASPFAAGLASADHRDLLDTLLWFRCDYGPGDPLRGSRVAVEILLTVWIPGKIVAGAGFLAKAPDLPRAFVPFCHHERGIRPVLTAAVDRWEPDYQRVIRAPRPKAPPSRAPRSILTARGHCLTRSHGTTGTSA